MQALLTIPDDQVQRIVTAFCKMYRYQAYIGTDEDGNPIPNPESAVAFSIRKRIEHMKETVKAYEIPDLAKPDRITRSAEIDAIQITLVPYVALG